MRYYPVQQITGMKDEFTQMAGGEEALLSHCGYAKRLAKSEEMAMPIVFLNSNMASYISGEHLIVDFSQTSEEIAGIKPVGQVISLKGILEYMKKYVIFIYKCYNCNDSYSILFFVI